MFNRDGKRIISTVFGFQIGDQVERCDDTNIRGTIKAIGEFYPDGGNMILFIGNNNERHQCVEWILSKTN